MTPQRAVKHDGITCDRCGQFVYLSPGTGNWVHMRTERVACWDQLSKADRKAAS